MKHRGSVVAERNNLKVIFCDACGFRHLDPIPDTSIYASGAYHSRVKPSMEDDYAKDKPWWNMVFADWLWMVEKLAPNKNLLDVGAGTGDFVRYAGRAGWRATGIEADRQMATKSGFLAGSYRDWQPDLWPPHFHKEGHGVISAHWLMEHLADPTDFLQWAHSILIKRGLLLFTIPNDFSDPQLRAMKMINRPYYWLHETHVNYWNHHSIRDWLPKHGFQIVYSRIYGGWRPELSLMMGDNYLDDPRVGRKIHEIRMRRELKMDSRERRKHLLAAGLMGWGRDLTFTARKV